MKEIKIQQPDAILNTAHYVLKQAIPKVYRNGVELEKGIILTERRIQKFKGLYERYCELWSVYPDLFLDLIASTTSHFKLFFYQRLFLRLCMRQGRLAVIAPRAFSKSFISILAMYLMCMFRPGIKLFICAKLINALISRGVRKKGYFKAGKSKDYCY